MKPTDQMFRALAQELNRKTTTLFWKNIGRLALLWFRYLFFGILFWSILFVCNQHLSPAKFLGLYSILFLLLGLFSYLFELNQEDLSEPMRPFPDSEPERSQFSRILTKIIHGISFPARGLVNIFQTFGDPIFAVTTAQFIFGMRFIHALQLEVSLDLLHDVYESVITRAELHRIFRFLIFLELISYSKKDEFLFVRPTKRLQQLKQNLSPPAQDYPSLREIDLLQGIVLYLQEKARERKGAL